MRGTGAERLVVAMNCRNGQGAKGPCYPVLGRRVNPDSIGRGTHGRETNAAARRRDDRSRMSREAQVRFWEAWG